MRAGEWSQEEIKTLFEIRTAVDSDRASSRSRGCEPTSPKWEVVAAQLATQFVKRTTGSVKNKYHCQYAVASAAPEPSPVRDDVRGYTTR